ncbi:MAG: IS256 family transposase, partial [Chloroflexota bacterium]
PDQASVLRLVGSVLIEVWDDWQVGRRYFSQESMAKLSQPEALLVVEPQPLTLAPVK